MSSTVAKRKGTGGRAARLAARASGVAAAENAIAPGMLGGNFLPLGAHDQQRIHHAALHILENVGVAGAIPSCIELVSAAGGRLNDQGRLCFPPPLVEDILAKACRRFTLHGHDPARSLDISGKRVHFGTGGAAVSVLSMSTNEYRQTRLADLYDLTRLIDKLEHIHLITRPVVAGDIADPRRLDLNTSYACMSGSTKPIGISFSHPSHVEEAVAMFDMALGGEGRFAEQPFCVGSNCFMVPPLKFAADSCACLETQVRLGMPVVLLAASQAGATAPAALAGAVTQAVAECLSGLVYVNLLSPGHPAFFGTWPLVSDLRTGAMSGGSGEQALLMAACAQMATFYDLPSSVAAGMTDSKLPDAQSGFEKGYSTTLAALAGASMVQESAGMQASLLGVTYEGFVIDNEMLGSVMRMVRGIEVTDESLSVETIAEVATGAGHYLGHPQTHALMMREYVYPQLSDRGTPDQWKAAGGTDIRQRARVKVQQVLSEHYPDHISEETDARIRAAFDIRLPRGFMVPGSDRW